MVDKINPEQESEAIRVRSEEPLEVLDYLVERSEKARLDVVRDELNERKKLPGVVPLDRLSPFTLSRLRNLESSKARYKKAIEHKQHGAMSKNGPTSESALIESPDRTKTVAVQNSGNVTDTSAGTWQAIEISFLSDERVQIRNGMQTETRNYAELAFEDRRNGKPNRAWAILRSLAEEGGIIRDVRRTNGEWPKIEKRMQEIRKALREHFRISADPIPFMKGTGYQARFKIGCGPSFPT